MSNPADSSDRTPAKKADANGFGGEHAQTRDQVELAAIQASWLAAIVESSDDAIISKDLNGIVATWNRGAERMFGYLAEEMIGESITKIIPAERLPEETAVLARLRKGEKVEHFETRRQTKDGGLIDISLTVSPIKDTSGRIVGASKVARDITERKIGEEALRRLAADLSEADRRKNEFLAMLAHELRNPLAPIRNGIQILRLTGPSSAAATYDLMDRQIGQLVRLVDDLLDVSRISRGKIELRFERLDLAQIVNDAVEALRSTCDAAGIHLTAELPPEPVFLQGDPARLGQVIGNLLHNSCKFTDAGGKIDVQLKTENHLAVLRICDTGVGIPAKELPFIFDLFVQAEGSRARPEKGLGIGLTLVKKLVELHLGSVSAHSEGDGKGAEFEIHLPTVSAPEPSPKTSLEKEELKSGIGLRILVVDDNVDAAMSLDLLLKLSGHEVAMAHDGLAAMDIVEGFRPDVVLLDIGLPGLNGYEVAKRIRQRPWGGSVILIALTGWGQKEDRERSKQAGIDRHMVKPIEHQELTTLLYELTSNN